MQQLLVLHIYFTTLLNEFVLNLSNKHRNKENTIIKFKTIKKLIGTGAIAFAFFSASLAIGTTVKAEETETAEISLQEAEVPPWTHGHIDGMKKGYEDCSKKVAPDPRASPQSHTPEIPNKYPTQEDNEQYATGFKAGYSRGYVDGWLEKHEPGNDSPLLEDGTPSSYLDTVTVFFTYLYGVVTAFFNIF